MAVFISYCSLLDFKLILLLLQHFGCKNEVATSKVVINRRSQTVWPTKIIKQPLFVVSIETSNFIYAFWTYTVRN